MKSVLTYSRAVLNGLGLTEWPDAINYANIPRSLLDTSYHLELGASTNVSERHDNIHISVPVSVRLFHSGYVETGAARDVALDRGEAVLDAFVLAATRLAPGQVKNVQFDSLELTPVSVNNDNIFQITVGFTALVIKSTR